MSRPGFTTQFFFFVFTDTIKSLPHIHSTATLIFFFFFAMAKGKLAKALAREKTHAKELNKKQEAVKRQAENERQKRAKNQAKQKKKPLIPFKESDKILLVGEGDFSFACSIIKGGLVKNNTLICTGLDSEEEVKTKYPNTAPENLQWLLSQADSGIHVETIFEIDGTKLHNTKPLSDGNNLGTFDTVIFNFPHCGNSIKDQHRNILQHQKLMVSFFDSAKKMIKKKGGRIVVTLFEGEPYVSWNIKKLAQSKDLKTLISNEFKWEAFPGYSHRLTAKEGNTSKVQATRQSRIYIFSNKDDTSEWKEVMKKTKNDNSSDDED